MIDEKNLQSEKLEDEELEKISGGHSGRVASRLVGETNQFNLVIAESGVPIPQQYETRLHGR